MEERLHEKCRNPAELVLVHILVCPPAPQGLLWGKDDGAWEALAGLILQQGGRMDLLWEVLLILEGPGLWQLLALRCSQDFSMH